MNNHNYIVIIAGGSGTRLWPLSRVNTPKQFHSFLGKETLLASTYIRCKKIVEKENIYISLNEKLFSKSQQQLKEISKSNFIIEPEAKNTAPAIALAVSKIYKKDPQAIIAVISADHIVKKPRVFEESFKNAFNFIEKEKKYFVVLGITPTSPHTGYGYIERGDRIEKNIFFVSRFIEKPNELLAKKFISSGNYLWNAGYFVFSARNCLDAFSMYSKKIYLQLEKIINTKSNDTQKKEINKMFFEAEKEPFDTAIMEKAKDVVVIPAEMDWSDVGSWASLYDLSKKDQNGIVGKGNFINLNGKNSLVFAKEKLIATIGIDNLVIIDTYDATLICSKEKTQDVKKLIEVLKEKKLNKYL